LIGPAAVLSAWFMGGYLTRISLDREREVTTGYVRQAVALAIPADALKGPAREWMEAGVVSVGQRLGALPEAVRVKVFDRDGTIVWSDEPRLIGANFSSDERVRQSLDGLPVAALERIGPEPEHAYEADRYSELTSVYVPIVDPDTGKVALVFEVYKLPALGWVRQGQTVFWSVAAGIGALALLSQLPLVRRAARTIEQQDADLHGRARQVARLNDELASTRRRLGDAGRLAALGEASAAVAHGLRAPLANVRVVAQDTLECLAPGDPLRQPLEDIMGQVDRLEARIDTCLGAARPLGIAVAPVTVDALLAGAVLSIHRWLAEAGVTVEVDAAAADGALAVLCDRARIEQALQEILANSAEAGARTVRVRCRRDDEPGRLRLVIEDDGAGLEASAQGRAFDAFFTTRAQGTGVGLAFTRRIVEAHGGSVAIAPRGGGGTVVTLRLPAASLEGAGG
jgi:signal transduction histidine kinase